MTLYEFQVTLRGVAPPRLKNTAAQNVLHIKSEPHFKLLLVFVDDKV